MVDVELNESCGTFEVELTNDNTVNVEVRVGCGITKFIDLIDTPTTYVGQGGKFIKVNTGETAVEFVTSSASTSWGDIIGTLSNQTDLQSELDDKIEHIIGGTNITVDFFDPKSPIISVTDNAKVTSVNGDSGPAVTLDTDDIADTATNRYTNDTDITRLANTSGTNTGDNATNTQYSSLVSNVTTNLSEGTATVTTVDVNSSDGTNATLVSASTTRAGLLTKAKYDEIVANTSKVTNATHSGEVTGATTLTIADNVIDEANLKLDEAATNDYVLTADSTKSGGMKWAIASSGFSDPMTTRGDIIYKNASNTTTRLPLGTNGQTLFSDGLDLVWSTPATSGDVTGPASSVDNNLATFDLTTGKIIQDSGINISAVTANTAKISYDSTSSTKVGFISVTQAVDLDTMESNIATNNAKISFDSTSSTRLANTSGTNTGDQDLSGYQPLATVLTNTTASYTTADETKVDFISVTQAVNLDTIESDTATNNAKISYPGSADATELNILDGATLTTIELNYVDGVTSPIQTQLNAKGTLSNIVEDTTPQLGGDLDGNAKAINSVTNIDYTGQSASPIHTLTDGATITPDFNNGNTQQVTLAGNRTLANPSNLKSGATYRIIVNQDATGSRTLTFGTAYLFSGGTAPTLTTTASAKDVLVFISDGTNLIGEFGGDYK